MSSSRVNRQIGAAVLAVAAAVSLAACSSSGGKSSGGSGGTQSLKLAYSEAFAGSASVLVAQDEGFFKKNHLDVQLVPLAGSDKEAAALASHSVDMISVTVDGALAFNASAKLNVQAVMGQNKQFFSLVANNNIPNNGSYPDNIKALKGKTIGVSALNSSPYYLLVGILQSAGMTKSDVRIVAVGKGPTRLAALVGGRVDAVMMSSDSVTATATGKAYVMVDMSKPGVGPAGLQNAIYGGVWAPKSYVAGHADLVNNFRKAMAQAMVWSADPANLAAYAKEVGKAAGASVPAANLTAAAQVNLENGNSGYYPASDLAAYYTFLQTNGVVKAIPNFNAADYIAPGTPTTQAQVDALAKS
jgi:ABC-type nitrate/sulfonate/bicarbonate transport system substrate-binding protein